MTKTMNLHDRAYVSIGKDELKAFSKVMRKEFREQMSKWEYTVCRFDIGKTNISALVCDNSEEHFVTVEVRDTCDPGWYLNVRCNAVSDLPHRSAYCMWSDIGKTVHAVIAEIDRITEIADREHYSEYHRITDWLGHTFEGPNMGDDFLWFRDVQRKEFRKLAAKSGLQCVSFGSHYFFSSAVFTDGNGHYVYIESPDVRTPVQKGQQPKWYTDVIYRQMDDAENIRPGSRVNRCRWNEIGKRAAALLENEYGYERKEAII